MSNNYNQQQTFCSFPATFSSRNIDQDDINGFYYLMNQLWSNVRIQLKEDAPEYYTVITSIVDGHQYDLPATLPNTNLLCQDPAQFVEYLQEILNLNDHSDLIVKLDNQTTFDFEILTKEAFLAELGYPLSEYRYSSQGLIHPQINATWAYIAEQTGKMFTIGEVHNFAPESAAYKAAFNK